MALGDIKDAGVLIEVARYGWPWHGVIADGAVGGSGHPHAQPAINESYLIDMGLPALDLTAEQIASEAAFGREWRNYALLPRGTVYNRDIGASSFIHVDEAGKPWRIDLAFSFPAAQTLRVTADITEFGVLQTQEVTAVTVQQSVDVACSEIELANGVDTYLSRYAQIEDVWTNGSKVLLGVLLVDGTSHDLFSVVTLTLSGEGGASGSGLLLAAEESIAQAALTTGVDTTTSETTGYLNGSTSYSGSNDCPLGETWVATFFIELAPIETWQIEYVVNSIQTYARYAFFSVAGDPVAVRLRMGHTDVISWPPAEYSLSFYTSVNDCQEALTLPGKQVAWSFVNETNWGVWLLENEAVVDSISRTRSYTGNWSWDSDVDGGSFDPDLAFAKTPDSETNEIFESGALAGYLPAGESLPTMPNTLEAFRRYGVSAYRVFDNLGSSVFVGIHRMNAKATAFAVQTPTTSVYGMASTPIGSLAVGIAPDSTTNFARQRKTGEYSFAANPICYV